MRFCRSVYRRGRIWWGKYRVPGGPLVQCSLGTDDKQAAETRLLAIYREAEQESLGMIPPRLVRQSAVRPLSEHLRDYLDNLRTMEVSPKYLVLSKGRLPKLCKGCKWVFLRDVSADSFGLWRSRQKKLSGSTLNHYLGHAQAFFSWMVDNGRAAGNPLSRIQKIDTRGKKKVVRRAFNFEELRRLVAVERGNRGAVYRFAAYTGLRREEVAALCWSDVILEGDCPRLVVRDSTTKNAQTAALPLHPSLVDLLRDLRGLALDVSGTVFPSVPTATTFNSDLRRCGIQKVDAIGRKVDFHALRGTFATMLNLHGATPRAAMDLMRHSDMKLTHQVYTDAKALPLLSEVRKIPTL